jgi:glycosyltransferase involved in cell wall biosynthesis
MPREILEAYALLKSSHPQLQLVIAGANRLRRPECLGDWLGELDLVEEVRILGWVKEKELAPLYRGAVLAFYLSHHEGFGLPPLECLACGTPVIVNPGQGLDDAWPSYPYRISGLTAEDIATAAIEILANPDSTARTMAEAANVTGGLSWEQSSRRLVAELRRAV